jgi:hypothetical protein
MHMVLRERRISATPQIHHYRETSVQSPGRDALSVVHQALIIERSYVFHEQKRHGDGGE